MKLCFGCMEEYKDELQVCPNCGYREDERLENAMHMEPGTILRDRYVVGKVIGYGGFGVTYIGYDAVLETKVAVKEYLPSEFSTRVVGQTQVTVFGGDKSEQFSDGMNKFIDEAKRLAKFSSENGIVKIFDSFECNNTAYIIMELLKGETLAERLKREKKIGEAEAVELMKPIISALVRIHREGVIHRDIAPDNIFLTEDGKVKLIDFGAARFAATTHSRSLTVVIKPGYSPEEQYRSRGDQGPHTDVYAAGAVLYRMLTGEVPPDALERRAYSENKKKDTLRPVSAFSPEVSRNVETAVMNALNVRIEDRTPDMQTFLEELTSTETVERRAGKIKAIDLYRWPLWAKIAFPTATVCLLTFAVLFVSGIIGYDAELKTEYTVPDGQTRVPSVINHLYEEGEKRLIDSQLKYEINGKVVSDIIPGDYILIQDISGGAVVDINSVIGLTISEGMPEYEMPGIIGMGKDEAAEMLTGLGFEVAFDERYDDTVAEGIVIEQSVPEGSLLKKGGLVTVSVSLGRDPSKTYKVRTVKVPDLTGKTYDDVLKEAAELGLTVKVSAKVYSKTVPKYTVISQQPEKGSSITTDKPLEIVLSLGFDQIELPDVTLSKEEEAVAKLKALSFKTEVTYEVSDTAAAGLVISQSPERGTKIDPESTVKLVVSSGAASFEMPDVVGMTLEKARETLTEKGLSVTVEYEYSNSVPENEIMKQSEEAGSEVKRGIAVTITAATRSSVISVPDLTGKERSAAENTLKNLGLTPYVSEVYSDSFEAGYVISQTPSAGTSLQSGNKVTLNVSKGKDPVTTAAATTTSTSSKHVTTLWRNNNSPIGVNTDHMNETNLYDNTSPDIDPANSGITSSEDDMTSSDDGSELTADSDTDLSSDLSSNETSTTTASDTTVSETDPDILPQSISLNETYLEMYVGESTVLSTTVTPYNAAGAAFEWSSSDTSVCRVSSGGEITALKAGTAVITVRTSNDKNASCTVKVLKSSDTISLDEVAEKYFDTKPGTYHIYSDSRGLLGGEYKDNPGMQEDGSIVIWGSNADTRSEISDETLKALTITLELKITDTAYYPSDTDRDLTYYYQSSNDLSLKEISFDSSGEAVLSFDTNSLNDISYFFIRICDGSEDTGSENIFPSDREIIEYTVKYADNGS